MQKSKVTPCKEREIQNLEDLYIPYVAYHLLKNGRLIIPSSPEIQ